MFLHSCCQLSFWLPVDEHVLQTFLTVFCFFFGFRLNFHVVFCKHCILNVIVIGKWSCIMNGIIYDSQIWNINKKQKIIIEHAWWHAKLDTGYSIKVWSSSQEHHGYHQPNKIMAYLTFHKWLVSVCNIHNNIWMVQTKTSHLGKVSYAIILLGWRYGCPDTYMLITGCPLNFR